MKAQSAARVLAAALWHFQLGASQSTDCPAGSSDLCIDPVAIGEARVDFLPLFSGATIPRFHYAFEMVGGSQERSMATKAGFWIEYGSENTDPSTMQETYMVVLMNENIVGNVSENSATACEQVLGARCTRELEIYLVNQMAQEPRALSFDSLPDALSRYQSGDDIPELSSCPKGVLDQHTFVSNSAGGELGVLAREDGDDTFVLPSGSPSSPWAVRTFEGVLYEQQLERVAVMIIAQIPLPDGEELSINRVLFEMECAKASPVEPVEDSRPNPGPGEEESKGANGPKGHRVSTALAGSLLAIIVTLSVN
ncbi:hypothetical protein ACRE_088830 [Hapsidospora chrysogenum ATCC 11550]|uniref:Uncharacterized protein n=1 Tax=Hapsidospora chrysogenum (strain ATCC 11550 / CBS 779.69 / DSM 880 / IAM 14645 / JCM 23072 / IMI 49137) TaxID=857340 RepID=A0A086STL9_HAPC1|nr:hypothetical protein ACRE_088830 [Hapsidospora chrysogenum ATCC 11550]